MLKRTDLIVGNYYTFHGKKNTECWWLYDNQPNLSLVPTGKLWPLEPFVFLGYEPNIDEDDPSYVYKVLTGDGTIGWLSLHDEDLEAFGITFKLYEEDDITEERS